MKSVVVVGAGLAGAAAAYRFALRGFSVTIVDVSAPGSEASAQNAGMQRRLVEDAAERSLAVWTGRWLADSPVKLPAGTAVKTGGLVVDAKGTFAAAADCLRNEGINVVSGDDVYPGGLFGLSTLKGHFCPDEHVLDAHSLIGVWLAAAKDLGAVVIRDEVLAITSGEPSVVKCSRTEVSCDWVVLATGAWGERWSRNCALPQMFYPMRRHLFTTSPSKAALGAPWVWEHDAGLYARPESGSFLVSPCDERFDAPSGFESTGTVEPEWRAWTQHLLNVHFPGLDGEIVSGWTGLRTFTADRRPLLGPDTAGSSIIWCTGLGGFGVTCGLAAAEHAIRVALEDDEPICDPKMVSPSRAFTVPSWAVGAADPWSEL